VRLGIIYFAIAVAAAPGSVAMYRIGAASRKGDGFASDLIAWRAILQSQLTELTTLVVLGTLTAAAYRKAILAVSTACTGDFPAEYVLVFGAGLTILLGLVYIPPSERLRHRAQAIVDGVAPMPDSFHGDWQEQMQRRHDLAVALKV
jgi:hypothetical protein